jgi:sulfide:quinone oxidoreductase
MSKHVLVLGAGFGGLELSTMLSEASGGEIEVTLIDKGDAFVFGFSKLDLMFGHEQPEAVRMAYADIAKPGVRVLRETVTEIDPEARMVTTDAGMHEADALVVALGADYDLEATPGLIEAGNEFYSVAGAERLAEVIPTFTEGQAVIGIADAPFKCPPAPSECALLLDEELRSRGVREACQISFVIPLPTPVPPSPEASAALEAEFAERGIERVPKHRAPDVVIASGMTEDGYVPVDSATLATRFPGVYAVGDVATAGVPKAGVFAEGAARVVAQTLIAEFAGGEEPDRHLGQGTCYIEFGGGRVGSVDIDFLSGPTRTGSFNAPSTGQVARKERFGSTRRARWFGQGS